MKEWNQLYQYDQAINCLIHFYNRLMRYLRVWKAFLQIYLWNFLPSFIITLAGKRKHLHQNHTSSASPTTPARGGSTVPARTPTGAVASAPHQTPITKPKKMILSPKYIGEEETGPLANAPWPPSTRGSTICPRDIQGVSVKRRRLLGKNIPQRIT